MLVENTIACHPFWAHFWWNMNILVPESAKPRLFWGRAAGKVAQAVFMKKKMHKPLKALTILIVLFMVVFVGLAIFVSTIDADKYRPQLVAELAKQTGRDVKLGGPIAFSLGFGGIRVSVQDASISNPAWGSRPVMASMGRFELIIGMLPLLQHRVSVDKLSIENADILLESNAAKQHNWDFGAAGNAGGEQTAAPVSPSAPSALPPVSVGKLSIINSQLSLRDADGKVSSFNVSSLDMTMRSSGAELKFTGDANGAAITLDLKTGITDLMSRDKFPFDADATYNAFHLKAKGDADMGSGNAEISSYEVTAGKTTIKGDVAATWNGPRPTIRGSLNSDQIDLADFKSSSSPEVESTAPVNANSQPAASGVKRIFSAAPLPFGALQAVNADLAVSVGALKLGTGELKTISAKLSLSNGNLILYPVTANVGASPVDVQLQLEAAQSPARLSVKVTGDGVDLGDLQKLGGMAPFMSGKAGANVQLTGQGNSLHEIASSLGGIIVVTAEKGEILTGAASHISSLLAAVFSPVGGDDAMECLAARFIAKNGVLSDNGILIDSTASVVSGKGRVNLDSEMVDMSLRAKTKLLDIGGLVPALQISGGLADPHYSVDAVSVVNNVVGSLTSGNIDVIASNVPDMQTAPAGQNACLYTLDNPKAPGDLSDILSTNPVTNAGQKIKNIGGSLIKGLFGQ